MSKSTTAAAVKRIPVLLREEVLNSITHGVGLVLSIVGLAVLVTLAALRGNAWHIVGCSVFGGTLVTLYASSTLYHGFRRKKLKQFFRVMDHVCIFLLIAGTYTPFTLTVLRGAFGWTLFGMVWTFAVVGIVTKLIMRKKYLSESAMPYVVMGCMALIAIKPIFESLPTGGLVLLGAGGLAYLVGVIFYARDSIPYFHTIWHLFVLAGSICHYFAVMFYVLPAST